MSHRLAIVGLTAAAVFSFPVIAVNQQSRVPGAEYDSDFPNEKPEPAPRRDLSGIWEPARGPGDAIQARGARNFPDTGRPEHELPFTPAGREAVLENKPAWGPRQVPSALSNDPQPLCEPQGFPRIHLHNYRTVQSLQTPKQVLILYQFNRKWRNIWTDGRANPTVDDFLEPRFWGYTVGRWQDDYTTAPTDGSAHTSKTGDGVLRGGSWKDTAEKLTSSYRRKAARDLRDDAVGLRCVLSRTDASGGRARD